jgi:hypothetical protein
MAKKYSHGIYKPRDRAKYVGTRNPRYLSSWELRFFRWCDNNPRVIKWGSETLAIPYKSPITGKVHKYLVDNIVHLRETDGTVGRYLIEIKPKKQTKPPTKHGNKKKTTILYEAHTYTINCAKWEAARAWALRHKYKFTIITEDELFFRQ